MTHPTAPLAVTGDVLRVERGQAGPEELAAVTAVLLARAAAQPAAEARADRPRAGWRRLERERGFPAPHSWRA
jgi:Acyl-CoA carboxylase epsilon subunit